MSNYMIILTLRELCIKNDWFNAGSNSQYDKMFALAEDLVKNATDRTTAIHRLADIIWVCTDDRTEDEIYRELEIWFDNMRAKETA